MKTREEAVLWLNAHGYYAFLRGGSFSETIGVASEVSETDFGLKVFGRLVYLFPVESESGRWVVSDLLTKVDYLCDDLQRAAEFSIRCLKNDDPRRDLQGTPY